MPIISETMHQVSERLESGAAYSDIILLHESARRKIYIATQGEKRFPRIVSWDDNNSVPYLNLRPSSGKCFQPGEYLVSVPPADYEQGFRLLLVRGDEEAEVLLHPVEVKRNATIDYGVVDTAPLKWRKFVDVSFLDYPHQGELFGEYRRNYVGNWPFANVPENYFSDSIERLEKAHPNERVELKLPDGYSIVAFGGRPCSNSMQIRQCPSV